jgi:hypothetical protein
MSALRKAGAPTGRYMFPFMKHGHELKSQEFKKFFKPDHGAS